MLPDANHMHPACQHRRCQLIEAFAITDHDLVQDLHLICAHECWNPTISSCMPIDLAPAWQEETAATTALAESGGYLFIAAMDGTVRMLNLNVPGKNLI